MDRRNRAHRPASTPGVPILALLSHDGQLMETVQSAAGSKWSVVQPGIAQLFTLIHEPNVKLVIFDDQLVAASERGRALREIRRCASKASIIYVSANTIRRMKSRREAEECFSIPPIRWSRTTSNFYSNGYFRARFSEDLLLHDDSSRIERCERPDHHKLVK